MVNSFSDGHSSLVVLLKRREITGSWHDGSGTGPKGYLGLPPHFKEETISEMGDVPKVTVLM